MKSKVYSVVAIVSFMVLQNCATLISIPNWHKKNAPVFYSGTRCDIGMMMENGVTYDLIYIFDLPFSFLLDTLLIPISLPFAAGMSRWHRQMMEFPIACYDG
ncbi:MAG: YceK/YidQ family lipoprotein [Leptospiraceae bacterium]|nr:YceK/YidQ family lipoprotein [Leptospiraceae bacterium]MBK9500699.1 YceK/YidQ family lipoprotein [Leptospiraceae bacterium]MBL0265374.1 YceK/YidQ family lipoprotein [Leptospiraceae bacterium]MBP9163670.1 YceK/YidQ family lipoprotein [Leptospiraceae bacterium]